MQVTDQTTLKQIWHWLEQVSDPEIPVISVVDLGIVRDVRWDAVATEYVVSITPTYSGCPATAVIADDIAAALREHAVENFRLETQLSPAWTTDWLSAKGREQLREYGIAPPHQNTNNGLQKIDATKIMRMHDEVEVACPRCGSRHTRQSSRFGSTPCKALYVCSDCKEPFDYFKPH
jgi:ring-1,2-phenylacetyl-CoA epoxidase subunit PaaD